MQFRLAYANASPTIGSNLNARFPEGAVIAARCYNTRPLGHPVPNLIDNDKSAYRKFKSKKRPEDAGLFAYLFVWLVLVAAAELGHFVALA